jgi:hypothetical protein
MQVKLHSIKRTTGESVRIIDVIRRQRNELIKDFLDERSLLSYLRSQYKVKELTCLQITLIKKDLKDLMSSPLNLEFL